MTTPAADDLPRPRYHFTPAKNWINDPNGLVYFDGEYHLFYQYNPHGNEWGHMSWGHAVSRDLLRWEELPAAIPEAGGVMAYSGSAVVDWQNTSGFGVHGQPPLVAAYTGRRTADDRQAQHLAYSSDRGRTWTMYAGNPVLDIGSKNFRDPKVFWHEPTRGWVMVVVLGGDFGLQLYRSTDLKSWQLLSQFGPDGFTAGVWECPDLFPLTAQGEPHAAAKWVLLLNVNPGGPAGGSGCYYYIGEFDGRRFVADSGPTPMDFGPDFYATVSWSDLPAAQHRRLVIGWMSNWQYAKWTPTHPWRGAMTLPRELGLRRVDGRLVLTQQPARELHAICRERLTAYGDVAAINQAIVPDNLTSASIRIDVDLQPGDARRCGVSLHVGPGQQTDVGYDADRQVLYVDRSASGVVNFRPDFVRPIEAPLRLRGGRVSLSIWVDSCSVEVFAHAGEVTLTQLIFPSDAGSGVRLFSDSRSTTATCTIKTIDLV